MNKLFKLPTTDGTYTLFKWLTTDGTFLGGFPPRCTTQGLARRLSLLPHLPQSHCTGNVIMIHLLSSPVVFLRPVM